MFTEQHRSRDAPQFFTEEHILENRPLGEAAQAPDQLAPHEHRLVAIEDARQPAADVVQP